VRHTLAALSVVVPAACGGAPPSPTDAGSTADGGCDASRTPAEDACVLDEAFGVFVSRALGMADGGGSRARPLATAAAGLNAAHLKHKRVYLCTEEYPEAVTLAPGDSIFGGLDCSGGWRVGTFRARLRAPTSPAVTARDLPSKTVLDSVEIIAPDAAEPGTSSIGVMAVDAPSLELSNATFTSGRAAAGIPGAMAHS